MMYRVYYSNGLALGSDEYDPEHLPARDVQVIVQDDPEVGWAMEHTRDYYVWRDGRWRGADIFGLWDYLARPGWKRVLFGRTLLQDEYQEIYRRAKADRDFARKAGYLPGERPQ